MISRSLLESQILAVLKRRGLGTLCDLAFMQPTIHSFVRLILSLGLIV
jgi:hypothetical protein